MNILGIKIDESSKEETLQKVSEFLHSDKSNKIFTPNPEMLVDAQKDEYFKTVLNSGDLNVCDGFGIQLLSRVSPKATPACNACDSIAGRRDLSESQSNGIPKSDVNQITNSSKDPSHRSGSFRMTRIPGVDLMLDICALAEKENKSVYLLGGGSDEVVNKTAEELKKRFPNLKVVGVNKGPVITDHRSQITDKEDQESDEIIHNIIMSAPDILFVAFGHGKQEKWIYENLKDLPSVRIAMGVGGSFDFISGTVKRAPRLIRKIGLEWMYRLFREPRRLPRIFNATFIFIFYFLKSVISDQ